MSVSNSVSEILDNHVTLEIESIDRMYLNIYVPGLQHEGGVASFFRYHRGFPFASAALMAPMTKAFINAIDTFVKKNEIPLVEFRKGERKDEVALKYLSDFRGKEGVLFVGKAQEKAPVCRTQKMRNPETGQTYPWLVRSTAMVNHYYFYCLDEDFGPFFLKFCSYFPYNAKMCINGNEYAKRQAVKNGLVHKALDNGFLSCEDPKKIQGICDGLSDRKINALLRKWLSRLPHPFEAKDRKAGYRYDISILQSEFSLTQVLDRPLTGRALFEEIIRENLDIGRPDQVQLIFNRPVTKRTPGRFRTRVITQGVTPSLHADYKNTRIKQYHKEGRALRTETTINNTRDFAIGKRLSNLAALRRIGFQANRRLLNVQRTSHDCTIGEDAFHRVVKPVEVSGQRGSALRFCDPRVMALFSALVLFRLLPRGFSNRELREILAPLVGKTTETIAPGRMSYDLRRLKLHGLIERIPRSHRYRVTELGLRTALFFTRVHTRIFRPGLSEIMNTREPRKRPSPSCLQRLGLAMDACIEEQKLMA